MTYLLDTDVVIDFLAGRAEPTLLPRLRREGLAVSVITLMEVLEGIELGRTPERARSGLRVIMRRTRIFVVNRPIAERAAAIRLDLRRQNHSG